MIKSWTNREPDVIDNLYDKDYENSTEKTDDYVPSDETDLFGRLFGWVSVPNGRKKVNHEVSEG